jgi:SAM-dependent methyltransferase
MSLMAIMSQVRGRLLRVTFGLLYDRLAFLHETTGRLAYGPAWDGRRRHVLRLDDAGPIMDVGCGEGKLLASLASMEALAFGIEPSATMARRARMDGLLVIQAAAQSLPVQDGKIQRVIVTYPGPWIIDRQSWEEIARVMAPGGTVAVLLGGDISRGRWSSVRRKVLQLAFGQSAGTSGHLPPMGNDSVTGDYFLVEDRWGQSVIWAGKRVDAVRPPDIPSIVPT